MKDSGDDSDLISSLVNKGIIDIIISVLKEYEDKDVKV